MRTMVATKRRSNWDHHLLEDPVPGNVVGVLEELGIEIFRVDNEEALAQCPAHARRTGKERSRGDWSVNTESGQHNCFSCGFRGPFYLIVKEVLGLGNEEAIDFVKSKGSIDRAFQNLTGEGLFINELAEEYTEADLALFVNVPDWVCHERDVEPWACDEYGVLWDEKKGRWITPVREWKTNKLMGYQEKGHDDRYFRNRPKGLEKGLTLFGVNQHKGDTALLVESPLDVVKIRAALDEPVGLGSYGATITDEQLNLMQDMGIKRLVSGLDNDKAGDLSNRDLIPRCRGRFHLEFYDYDETDAKDPGDQEDYDICESYVNAYPVTEWVPSWL